MYLTETALCGYRNLQIVGKNWRLKKPSDISLRNLMGIKEGWKVI
jgi:hypothetical protein